ncbi:MAG: oligosaccharide flippase family protein [Steroidobacteraceae bacterium]|jgi:O-antigen/teichoic acid export membrane protein
MRVQLFWAFLWKGIGITAAFLSSVLIARILGAEQAGWVALGQTTASVVSTLALLGIDSAAMRELSGLVARGAGSRAQELVATAFGGACLTAAAIIALSLIATLLAQDVGGLSSQAYTFVLIGIVAAVGLAGSRLTGELLRATGSVGAAVWFQTACGPLILLSGVLVWHALLSDYLAVWMVVVGEGASATWAIAWWRKTWSRPAGRLQLRTLATLLRAGSSMFLIGFGTVLIGWIEMMALSHWSDSRSIALFSAAQRVASLVALPLLIINLVAAPRYAALYATRSLAELRILVGKVIMLSGLLGLPLLLVVLFFGSGVLDLFGPQFGAANLSLRVILVGQLINLATGPVIYLLMMGGKERAGLACVAAGLVVDVICLSLLVPHYGLIGAAISNATAVSVVNLSAAVLAYGQLFRRQTADSEDKSA